MELPYLHTYVSADICHPHNGGLCQTDATCSVVLRELHQDRYVDSHTQQTSHRWRGRLPQPAGVSRPTSHWSWQQCHEEPICPQRVFGTVTLKLPRIIIIVPRVSADAKSRQREHNRVIDGRELCRDSERLSSASSTRSGT